MVQAGDLDGYQRAPWLIRSDGSRLPAEVRVRACDIQPPHELALAVVLPEPGDKPDVLSVTLGSSEAPSVIGLVDAEWRISHVSSTSSELFERPAEDMIGESVLTFVHDNDVAELLVTLGQSVDTSHSASMRVRWRRGSDEWVFCRLLVTPLGNSQLPAFAFVMSALPGEAPSDQARLPEMEMRLRRIAREVQAAGAVEGSVQVSERRTTRNLADLSPREWEVVGLLLAGERVPSIARTLFLSQSTVRNHLSSVFRKTGMHSQQELLRRLRGTPT
jgi:DNA-binding CsgD family transcriptional regulator